MDSIDYWYELDLKSNLTAHLAHRINTAVSSEWTDFLDMSILSLTREDFITEPKLLKVIDTFNCHDKLGIYKYTPNFCYQWHTDAIRNAAINLQLQGEDSFCVFGKLIHPRKFSDVVRLKYEPNKYYIFNTTKFHSVFNFNNPRYLLSVGFHKPITYDDVKQYAIENSL